MVRKLEYGYRISKSFRLRWTQGDGDDDRCFRFCYMWKVKDRYCINSYFSMKEFPTKKQLEDYELIQPINQLNLVFPKI